MWTFSEDEGAETGKNLSEQERVDGQERYESA